MQYDRMVTEGSSLRSRDTAVLTLFCVILFGWSMFNGRPLTMHEARLPQTSREMLADHHWLFPQSGSRPWLERPPLPHWITVAVNSITGFGDEVLYARLPTVLVATLTVLLTVWIATQLLGRTVGVLSGFVLATMIEFYRYATLAEDDIYLAAMVALAMAIFVKLEFAGASGPVVTADENPSASPNIFASFFGFRPPLVLLLFVVTGLTNLTKGPLLGVVIIASTIGLFQLLTLDRGRIMRYVWLLGWLVTILLTIAWPLAAYKQFPDVLDNWKFDYLGRVSGGYDAINQPPWYYLLRLPECLAPWTPLAIYGLWITWPRAKKFRFSPLRLVWIWAIVPILIFSIPRGKHHHYLVPMMAPWAMLSAVALVAIGQKLQDTRPNFNPRLAMAITMAVLLIAFSVSQSLTKIVDKSERTVADTQFLRQARSLVPENRKLFINADLGSMDFFRLQFYSRSDAILLHNLTFLRDEKIQDGEVYVITRAKDQQKLETLGKVAVISRSEKSHDDGGKPQGLFTLFKLTFDPDLLRFPAPTRITSLQAMDRAKGPYCGPEFSQ